MEITIGRIFKRYKKANVVMWKDEEYEYISSPLNHETTIRSSPFIACEMPAEKNVEYYNRVRCGNRFLNQHSF